MKGVVLLSGGIDSTTCLALAVREWSPDQMMAVSFEYGQKHRRELDHASAVAQHYGIRHDIVVVPAVFSGARSTLLVGGPNNPQVSYDDLAEGVSPAYVPFRNGLFLSLAAAIALSVDAEYVYFGAHAEDGARWAYPDCTPEFIGAMASALFVGSYMRLRLMSPLQWMRKRDVVAAGLEAGAPLHLTMSCYEGAEPACGVCPTCRSRREAFESVGLRDPIAYAAA